MEETTAPAPEGPKEDALAPAPESFNVEARMPSTPLATGQPIMSLDLLAMKAYLAEKGDICDFGAFTSKFAVKKKTLLPHFSFELIGRNGNKLIMTNEMKAWKDKEKEENQKEVAEEEEVVKDAGCWKTHWSADAANMEHKGQPTSGSGWKEAQLSGQRTRHGNPREWASSGSRWKNKYHRAPEKDRKGEVPKKKRERREPR